MFTVTADQVLPCTITGSWPRPRWLGRTNRRIVQGDRAAHNGNLFGKMPSKKGSNFAHRFAGLLIQERRWRFFDYFLVPALDGTLPFP